MKQLGPDSKPVEQSGAAQSKPDRIIVDDFDFFNYLDRQNEIMSAMRRVTDKYNEILRRRYVTDPVTVVQYVTVELANRETVIRQIGLPDQEVLKLADDLGRKITALLEFYKSMPRDSRFACEASVQAFKRQIRLEGGMARLVTAYQSDLKAAYMSYDRTVLVILPFGNSLPKLIKPSQNKENQYRSNLIEGQFAVSGPRMMDYIMRAAIGGRMYTNGDFSVFPESPIAEFKTDRRAVLVRPVAICSVSALETDPETAIDFAWSDEAGLGPVKFLPFGGEWTRKTRGLPESMKMLPVLGCHVITWAPSEYFLQKSVRCRGVDSMIDLSGLCRTSLDPSWQLKNKV